MMWNTARLEKGNSDPCNNHVAPIDTNPVGYLHERFSPTDCDMDSCIHYFICNNRKQYLLYFYTEKDSRQSLKSYIFSNMWKGDKHLDDLRNETYFTTDPTRAWFFVLILDLTNSQRLNGRNTSREIEEAMYSLPHWNNDGTNNIIIFLTDSQHNQDLLWSINTQKAIVAQTAFKKRHFRRGFDMVIPPVVSLRVKPVQNSPRNLWREFPKLSPAYRQHLISMLSYVDTSPSKLSNIETTESEFTSEFRLHFQIQSDLHNSKDGDAYLLMLDYGYECRTKDCRYKLIQDTTVLLFYCVQ